MIGVITFSLCTYKRKIRAHQYFAQLMALPSWLSWVQKPKLSKQFLNCVCVSERFLRSNGDLILPFTFRPFGGGNRNCIGSRFAMTEMKICVAKLLHKFRLEIDPETRLNFRKVSLAFLKYEEFEIKFVERFWLANLIKKLRLLCSWLD